MRISVKSIRAVAEDTLARLGMDEESVRIITDTILFANQRGVATHGVGRLPLYVKKVRAGHINPRNEIKTVADFGATAVLDARNCMGQVAAYRATELALQKAEAFGAAAVGVRNSNNFGTAGYFGDLAARRGMVALVFANAAPAIAPTGGNKTIFGTNPLCFAFPGGEGRDPVILDMATTVAARGKIRLAAKNGEKIPLDWAIGPDGNPTDDPNEALKGSLLPIGGYKGYGLSMFVDLLAGLLTGSAHGGEVKNLSKMDADSGNGHLFILLDARRFLDGDGLKAEMEAFCGRVKQCGPEGAVFMPGEKEYRFREEHPDWVELSDKQVGEVNEAAAAVSAGARLEEYQFEEEQGK